MARLPEIDETKLSSEQKQIYNEVKRVRGQVRGPFAVWLRNAELVECTLKLQDLFASRVKLERRLVQLMILVLARLASAQFAWFIHEPHALKLGISAATIVVIAVNSQSWQIPLAFSSVASLWHLRQFMRRSPIS